MTTQKPKFTPGPWKLEMPDYDHSFVPSITIGKFSFSVQDAEDGTYREANANLIAAAPDLYEACERLLALEAIDCLCVEHFKCAKCNAIAALSKARGEKP